MRFIQINLNHSEAAHCLLRQSILELDMDVTIISKSHKEKDEAVWAIDRSGMCVIWTTGGYPFEKIIATFGNGFIKAKVNGVHVYSFFAPLGVDYERMLRELVLDANT